MSEQQLESSVQAASEKAASNFTSSIYDTCRAVPAKELLQDTDYFKGKVVLVTGAGSGIGYAFCTFAATLGSKLILVDWNEDSVKVLKKEIDESVVSGEVFAAPRTSVVDWESLRSVFEWADKKFGGIDCVVACAGVTEDQHPSFDTDAFDNEGRLKPPSLRTLDVNLTGTIYTTKLSLHYMRKRKTKGSIVLLGSLSSFFGLPMAPMYTTSKHGVLGFTRAAHYTAQPDGINVNMVAPWFVKTPILNGPVKLLLAGLPYTRMPDVVNALVFAASNRKLAGASLPVDPKGVFVYPHDSTARGTGGFHNFFEQRAMALISWVAVIRDFLEVTGPTLLVLLMSSIVGYVAWRYIAA